MSNDIRSQNVAKFIANFSITEDGIYPLDPIDTESLLGIGFYMGLLYRNDGSYTVGFDDSDNGVDWSEVPSESLIGELTVTADFILGDPFDKVGVFSVKRYLRPKIIATNVIIGVGGIGVLSVESPRILEAKQ